MANLKAIKEETDRLSKTWSEYENELYTEHKRISDLDLSRYSDEYKAEERERLWSQGAKDRNTAFNNVEKHCIELETKLKATYDNVSLLEQRKRFAAEKGLTLMEADNEIKRYVSDTRIPVEDIMDPANTHHQIFIDELKRSGRLDEKVILTDTSTRKLLKGELSRIKTRIQELRESTFSRFAYSGADAMLNMFKLQQED